MQAMQSSIPVGLDIGSVRSCVTVCPSKEFFPMENDAGDTQIPTCAMVHGRQIIFGSLAWSYVEQEPEKTWFSFKRFIGKHFERKILDELPYRVECPEPEGSVKFPGKLENQNFVLSAVELLAMYLQYLHEQIKKRYSATNFLFVLGVPNCYSKEQRDALMSACKIAKLDVTLLDETTALATGYALTQDHCLFAPTINRGAVIISIGYMHTQVVACELQPALLRVLATRSDAELGGYHFDQILTSLIIGNLTGMCSHEILGDERRKVLGCITGKLLGIKKQLDTDASVVSIKFNRIITKTDMEIRILRSQFQAMCSDILSRLDSMLRKCLTESGLKPEQITDVCLVGGTCRIREVARVIHNVFGREGRYDGNGQQFIASGCAFRAISRGRNQKTNIEVLESREDFSVNELNKSAREIEKLTSLTEKEKQHQKKLYELEQSVYSAADEVGGNKWRCLTVDELNDYLQELKQYKDELWTERFGRTQNDYDDFQRRIAALKRRYDNLAEGRNKDLDRLHCIEDAMRLCLGELRVRLDNVMKLVNSAKNGLIAVELLMKRDKVFDDMKRAIDNASNQPEPLCDDRFECLRETKLFRERFPALKANSIHLLQLLSEIRSVNYQMQSELNSKLKIRPVDGLSNLVDSKSVELPPREIFEKFQKEVKNWMKNSEKLLEQLSRSASGEHKEEDYEIIDQQLCSQPLTAGSKLVNQSDVHHTLPVGAFQEPLKTAQLGSVSEPVAMQKGSYVSDMTLDMPKWNSEGGFQSRRQDAKWQDQDEREQKEQQQHQQNPLRPRNSNPNIANRTVRSLDNSPVPVHGSKETVFSSLSNADFSSVPLRPSTGTSALCSSGGSPMDSETNQYCSDEMALSQLSKSPIVETPQISASPLTNTGIQEQKVPTKNESHSWFKLPTRFLRRNKPRSKHGEEPHAADDWAVNFKRRIAGVQATLDMMMQSIPKNTYPWEEYPKTIRVSALRSILQNMEEITSKIKNSTVLETCAQPPSDESLSATQEPMTTDREEQRNPQYKIVIYRHFEKRQDDNLPNIADGKYKRANDLNACASNRDQLLRQTKENIDKYNKEYTKKVEQLNNLSNSLAWSILGDRSRRFANDIIKLPSLQCDIDRHCESLRSGVADYEKLLIKFTEDLDLYERELDSRPEVDPVDVLS